MVKALHAMRQPATPQPIQRAAEHAKGSTEACPTMTTTDHPQTPEQLRVKAETLWQLLDDISTAFDMHKPKMEGFERYVWFKCEQRSKQFQSDGYKLYATESPNAPSERQSETTLRSDRRLKQT